MLDLLRHGHVIMTPVRHGRRRRRPRTIVLRTLRPIHIFDNLLQRRQRRNRIRTERTNTLGVTRRHARRHRHGVSLPVLLFFGGVVCVVFDEGSPRVQLRQRREVHPLATQMQSYVIVHVSKVRNDFRKIPEGGDGYLLPAKVRGRVIHRMGERVHERLSSGWRHHQPVVRRSIRQEFAIVDEFWAVGRSFLRTEVARAARELLQSRLRRLLGLCRQLLHFEVH
mmetsp:Transcript_13103/g.25031  ORF Transcript_13103/g.25031 Transcript_13103/m.25031 type:complete len:224 (-) Transcript_13103:1457-2128(-)